MSLPLHTKMNLGWTLAHCNVKFVEMIRGFACHMRVSLSCVRLDVTWSILRLSLLSCHHQGVNSASNLKAELRSTSELSSAFVSQQYRNQLEQLQQLRYIVHGCWS